MAEYKPCLTCYHMAVCYKIEHYGRDIHSKIPCGLYMSNVDTETVVRCKDCIHREVHPDGENAYYLTCNLKWGLSGTVAIEDYCSYGKRKDG